MNKVTSKLTAMILLINTTTLPLELDTTVFIAILLA